MENGVINVARMMDPRAWEVHVACLTRRGAFAERLPNPANTVVLGKTSGFSLGAVRALRRHIARIQPAVIHTHNLGPLIYAALATLCGRACPILHGEHSQLTDEERTPKRLRQRRWLYRCCRKVHTVSHGQRDELLALGFSPKKITVIVNGVDTKRFSPGNRSIARVQLGLRADALVIGIVGRFGPFKRHAALIEAFERLADEMPALELLIVGGGGPEADHVANQVAHSAHRDRIHLAGFQNEPLEFYRTMDLLAVPSINEGLSNAVLEAMACGVPVLAHAVCGNAEVVTHGADGFVARLDTTVELCAQLKLALKDPQRLQTCGVNARHKITEGFSLENMVAGYAALYREITGDELR